MQTARCSVGISDRIERLSPAVEAHCVRCGFGGCPDRMGRTRMRPGLWITARPTPVLPSLPALPASIETFLAPGAQYGSLRTESWMLVAVPSCDRTPLPLRAELPAPGSVRSSTTTLMPRPARKYAQERPMNPAPTIATSAFGLLATGSSRRSVQSSLSPAIRPSRQETVCTLARPAVIYPGRWLIRTPPSQEARTRATRPADADPRLIGLLTVP